MRFCQVLLPEAVRLNAVVWLDVLAKLIVAGYKLSYINGKGLLYLYFFFENIIFYRFKISFRFYIT